MESLYDETSKQHSRPRSNTCPNLNNSSKRFVVGSKVIILRTQNVEQRHPQYIGIEGEIMEMPGKPLF